MDGMARSATIDRILSTIGDALDSYDRDRIAEYRVVLNDTAPRMYYATSAVDALRIARTDMAPGEYVLDVECVERASDTAAR
jgi:hypothetical protein